MALQGFLNGLVMAGKGGERGKLGSPFNDRHRRPFVGNGALQIDDVSVVGNIFQIYPNLRLCGRLSGHCAGWW